MFFSQKSITLVLFAIICIQHMYLKQAHFEIKAFAEGGELVTDVASAYRGVNGGANVWLPFQEGETRTGDDDAVLTEIMQVLTPATKAEETVRKTAVVESPETHTGKDNSVPDTEHREASPKREISVPERLHGDQEEAAAAAKAAVEAENAIPDMEHREMPPEKEISVPAMLHGDKVVEGDAEEAAAAAKAAVEAENAIPDMEHRKASPEKEISVSAMLHGDKVVEEDATSTEQPRDSTQNSTEDPTTTLLTTSPQPTPAPTPIRPPKTYQPRPYDPNKPNFYLHVGPAETGITTIQTESFGLDEILKRDGYFYVGRKSRDMKIRILGNVFRYKGGIARACEQQFEEAYRNHNNVTLAPCWQDIHREIEPYRKLKYNLILADEKMSSTDAFLEAYSRESYFEALHSLMEGWNLIVVVNYQRFFEWSLAILRDKWRRVGGCFGFMMKRYYHWGGKSCTYPWSTLNAWKKSGLVTFNSTTVVSSQLYLDKSIALWKKYGFIVKILNYHEPNKTVIESFYCDLLEDAPNTCRHFQQNPPPSQPEEPAVDTAFYDWAVMATRRSIIDTKNTTRLQVLDLLMDYHKNQLGLNYTHLPLICPSQESLQQYLQHGMELEQKLVPEFYNPEDYQKNFWQRSKEFCYTDVNKLVAGCTSLDDLKKRMNNTSWEAQRASESVI